MGFLRRKVQGRFRGLGRMGDVAIVGGTALRLANRKGLVSDEMAAKFGAAGSSGGSGVSISELALAGGALLRLAKKARSRRR